MELYFPHDPDNEIPDELVEPEPPVVEAPKSKKGKRGKSGKKWFWRFWQKEYFATFYMNNIEQHMIQEKAKPFL